MSFTKKSNVLCLIATLFLGLLPFITAGSSVYAAENETYYDATKVENSFREMSDVVNKSSEITDAEVVDTFKDIVRESIHSGKVFSQSTVFEMDFEHAKVLSVKEDNSAYTSVTIPVSGASYSLLSNVTVILDSNNNVVAYTETLLTKSVENTFAIDFYVNGNLLESKKTDIAFVDDTVIQKGIDELHDIGLKNETCEVPGLDSHREKRGAGKIAACIAAILGVDGGIAYLIAGTCAASCPAVPPICAACIGAVATVGVGNIAGVVGCFKL